MCVVTIAIVFKYFKLIIIVSTNNTIKLCVVPCTCVICVCQYNLYQESSMENS